MFTLRRIAIGFLAITLVVQGAPTRAAEVDKLLPDNTEFIVVVNVKQLVDAPLIQKYGLEQLKGMLKSNEEVSQILDALGFDPFKDLASVTVAGSGIGLDAKGLLIAHGQFDLAKFDAKAEEVAKTKGDHLKVHKEGDRKIYEVKAEERPLFVGLVNKTTLVGSPEKDAVLDAFAKASGLKKGTLNKEVQTLIEKAEANQSFWFGIPGSALAKSDLSAEEKAKKSIEKIDSITAGLTVAKDIKFNLTVNAKNADGAKELTEELKQGLDQAKGLLAILAGQMKELAPVVDIVSAMKLDTDGNKIVLKSEVTEEQVEKGLKKQ